MSYVKSDEICLVLKAVKHKSSSNFQSLFMPTH